MGILAGIVFILFGLLYLFAGDVLWSLQKFGNDLDGQVSRRGDVWEAKRLIVGVMMVFFGVVLLGFGIFS